MADLTGAHLYCCHKCDNLVSRHDHIINKEYQCSRGRAYLFYEARNVKVGAERERMLISGRYIVSDIYCHDCEELLGWRYIKAYNVLNKFKEGKVVLEKFKITTQT